MLVLLFFLLFVFSNLPKNRNLTWKTKTQNNAKKEKKETICDFDFGRVISVHWNLIFLKILKQNMVSYQTVKYEVNDPGFVSAQAKEKKTGFRRGEFWKWCFSLENTHSNHIGQITYHTHTRTQHKTCTPIWDNTGSKELVNRYLNIALWSTLLLLLLLFIIFLILSSFYIGKEILEIIFIST